MGAFSAISKLLIALQLVLALQPQGGGDKAQTVQNGHRVIFHIAVFLLRPVPLAHQQDAMYPVKILWSSSNVGAQPLVVQIDLLVRHHIGRTVQDAGEGHIVPGLPLGSGNALPVQHFCH